MTDPIEGCVRRARSTNHAVARDAKSELVDMLSPVANSVVQSLNVPVEMTEDARQSAYLGALVALEKFDTTRGVKFVTYAWPYMQKEIFDNVYGTWSKNEIAEDAIEINSMAEHPVDSLEIEAMDARLTAIRICGALAADELSLLWEHGVRDVPQAEIARRSGHNKMQVSRSMTRARARARSIATSTH